jgi:glycerophosphoryl diester phosphodiesterase
MLLLGHRGASRYAPENTLAAFEVALAHGAHGIEFDLRACTDGHVVVCHDSRLNRRTIARSSWPELFAECPDLALVEQVLARFSSRAYLYLDVKVPGLEDAILSLLRKHPPERGYVVASTLPDVIAAFHQRDPGIPLGFVATNRWVLPRWRRLPVCVVMPQYELITSALVEEIHKANKEVFAWTVNEAVSMRSLAKLGVDGILSNDTRLLTRTLGT